MRILTVCYSLGIGGSERAAQNSTFGFQAAGHEVAFLNYSSTGPREAILRERNVPVFSANGDLNRAVAAAKNFAPDVIHIHRRGRRSDLETDILKTLKGRNTRVLEQNIFGEADYSEGSKLIDVHLHLSAWCLWRWRRFLGDESAPAVAIGNPISGTSFFKADKKSISEFRNSIGIQEGSFVCGRVGQPSTANWHPVIINAFAAMMDYAPSAYLLLIGAPPEVQDAIRGLPSFIRDRIKIMPMTPDDAQLRLFYSSLDCFIHIASQGESFGLVLTEAMLCGCPVVTVSRPHRGNSQVEVVGHLKGGIVAGSIEYLNDAVKRMYMDHNLRESLTRQCRDHVLNRFELDIWTDKVLRIAELALSCSDRKQILRKLSADELLYTEVSDIDATALYSNVLGTASRKEIALMQIYHNKYYNTLKSRVRRFIRNEV